MSNDKLYDDILTYITENGETGVNALARACNVPLTNMQRYLERQTYFRKTVNRKWDLPDKVNTNSRVQTVTLMVDSVENTLMLLASQLDDVRNTVQTSLMPIETLRRSVKDLSHPVAGNSSKVRPRLVKLDEKLTSIEEAIKGYMKNVPEEYKDVLKNLDLTELAIQLGGKFLSGDFNDELMRVLTGQSDKLSDDILDILMEYQYATDEDE